MYITQFGSYTLPTEQLEMSESTGQSRRGSRQALGGAGGSFDAYGTGPDPLAEDTINKSFIIEAASPTALQTAVDSFIGEMMLSQNDWRQGSRLLIGTLPDGTKRATWAKCTEARGAWEYFHVQNAWLPVNCTFVRTWPTWFDYEDVNFLGDHLGTFADTAASGITFGDGANAQTVNTSPATFTLTNNGKARVMAGLIEFDGAITNPTVTNLTNKHWFSWTGALIAGDRLTLDIASYAAKKNGVNDQWPLIALGAARGQLQPMVLEPGANSMKIESTGPNCTFRFYFSSAW